MNYSAGNLYERMFCEESSASVHALLMYGLAGEARRLMEPLLDYGLDPHLNFHNVAFQLQLLARWHWLTKDRELTESWRPRWTALLRAIEASRAPPTGLLPQEAYCGDLGTLVDSLNTNANCWRGLRDFAVVLGELGDREEAARLAGVAAEFRAAILKAADRSVFRDTEPPFVPVALFGAERPVSPLTATMQGSYWILMSNYLLRSGVFAGQPEKNRWIVEYLQRHGGLCMGMLRFDQHSGLFANTQAFDDLYTLGYVMHLLQQDEPDRALVTFYGKLAHGLTRDTFVGAEGTGLVPLDAHGRAMYLPPNSASQALFLWILRHLLVQDLDLDDDGRPETLRLLFATPRHWLRDGARLRCDGMPTAFGPVSIDVQPRLDAGAVQVDVQLPPVPAPRTLLRLRLPLDWRIRSVDAGGRPVALLDAETADLTGLKGDNLVRFAIQARRDP